MKRLIFILAAITLTGCNIFGYPDCDKTITDIQEMCMPRVNQNLDSGGGLVLAALEISKHTIYTHVENECSSACVMIAASGTKRSACSDARFGLHQATASSGTQRMKEFYSSDPRIDSKLVNHYIDNTPNNRMRYYTAHRALTLGLIDEVLDCD